MDMGKWGFGREKISWPALVSGEKVPPAFLRHLSERDMAVDIALNKLAAHGIPVVTEYPGDGSFGKVILGMSGTGVDLYVPETMLEDAKFIMEEITDVQS